MFAGKKSAQIREILISESAWEEMTCLFAPSLSRLMDLSKGWYSGIYEASNKVNTSLNANTNGVVLESLAFINGGKLLCAGCTQAIQPVGTTNK